MCMWCEHVLTTFYPTEKLIPASLRCLIVVVKPPSGITLYVTVCVCACVCLCVYVKCAVSMYLYHSIL